MATPIASLFIEVGADVSAAVGGLNALGNQLNATTNQFKQATPAALALTGAAAGIGAAFVGSVKVAADFEHAMSGVRAVMAPDEVKQFGGALDDLAVSLGAATSFTATQVAGAFEELLKLGVSAPSILAGAGAAALSLAAATGAPVSDAATVAAQALNAFHLQVSDLPGVVDTLAGVINVTAADLNDIKLGFSDVAAVAHGLGLSFTDTAVTLGIFRDNALTGNTAGTALKTMLLGLQPSTKQQTGLFKQLGLITADGSNVFFDAAGNVKDMASVSGALNTALGGMTKQQRAATLEILFGTQGMLAANIIMDTGAEGIRKYTADVKKISAADQAAERLNNLLGAMEQLGGAVQSLQIKIGNLFLPQLKAMAQAVQGVVQSFLSLTPEQQRTAALFVAISGAIAGAVGGAVLLAAGWHVLGPSFLAVGRVLLGLVPIFRVVALVAGVLAAAWATDLFGIREKVQAAFGLIPVILDKVNQAFSSAGDLWTNTVMPALQVIGNEIERRIIPIFNALASGPLGNLGLVLQKVLAGDLGGAVDTFQAILGGLLPGLGPIIAGVRAFADRIGTTIGAGLARVGPILGNFGLVFEKILAGDVGGAFDTLRAIIGALSPDIGRFVDGALELLKTGADSVATFWNENLSPALGRLGAFLETEVAPKIRQFVDGVLPTLKTGAETVRLFWDTQLAPAFGKVAAFLETEVAPKIQAFVDATLPKLNEGAQAIITFWNDQLMPTLRDPGPTLDALATSFEGAVGRIGKAAETGQLGAGAAGLALFFASFDTIKGQVESLKPLFDSIGEFAGSLINLNTAIAGLAARSAAPLFGDLGDAIKGFGDKVVPSVPGLLAVTGTLGTIGGLLQPVRDVFHNLSVAINELATAILNFNAVQLPDPSKLAAAAGLNPGGPNAGTGTAINAGLNSAAQNATLGPLVQIGQLVLGSEVDAQRFIADMAARIAAAAGRVTAPPDNSAFPALNVAP